MTYLRVDEVGGLGLGALFQWCDAVDYVLRHQPLHDALRQHLLLERFQT